MRALVSILIGLLPLTGQQAPPRDTPAPGAPAGGVIRGRVVGADTHAPIVLARVWIRDADGGTFDVTAFTDERGRFEARRVPPGDYRVTALPPDNRARYLISSSSPRPLAVSADAPPEPLELVLPVAAAISGRVLDEAGEPLARVAINVRRFGASGAQPQPVGNGFTQSDDQGRFRVFSLEEGEYVLSAGSDAMMSHSQDSPQAFVETFYPSTTTLDEASRIQVKPGQDLDGIDIRLIRTKTYRIAGTILFPDGQPAGRANASLLRIGGNGQEISVDPAGRFEGGGLLPGTYDVSVSGSSVSGARVFGRTRFTVADADVIDLVVTTSPGVDVRGRVIVSQEKGPLPPKVQVETTRIDTDGKTSWIPARFSTEADASFVLNWLYGPTIVRVRQLPPGWMVKAILLNGDDITDKPTEFRAQDSGHLEVLLTRRASVIEGSVKDDRDRPVDDYTVVLFSSNRADWIVDSSRTHVTHPRSDARFRFDNVRAGSYWMIAVPRDRAGGSMYSSSGLEPLVKDASEVVVGDEDHRSVDLRLVRRQ